MIRILHLSDLAFDLTQWRAPTLAGGLVEIARTLRPDVIAVTGDLAASGTRADLDRAVAWLSTELLPAVGVPRDRLLLVPGERDVAPEGIDFTGRAVHDLLLREGHEKINEVLADPTQRAAMLRRLQPWLEATGAQGEVPWWSRRMEIGGLTVGFAGLCSAWAAEAKASDRGRLLVGRWQVETLLGALEGCAVRVVLVHHPAGELHESDAGTERRIARGAHLLLRGHDTLPSARGLHYGEDRLVEVVAGPAFGEGSGSFALIEVEPHAIVVRPHKWVESKQRWQPDLDRGDLGVERFTATAPSVAAPPVLPSPLSLVPKHAGALPDLPDRPYPVLGPTEHPWLLGGRDADLDALQHALTRDQLVLTLHAPSGAGKSSLLRAGLLPRLRGQTGAGPSVLVAFDEDPQVAGLPHRLLTQLTDTPLPDVTDPSRFAEALASLRDASSQRPVLVLDQFERAFRDPGESLNRLGPLLSATAVARGGPACRWLLAYRHEVHSQVWHWLRDVLAYSKLDADIRERLPGDLEGRSLPWPLPVLGNPGSVVDRVAGAAQRFSEAINRPLAQGIDGWWIDPDDADRLARCFGEGCANSPDVVLGPELQTVLARLMEDVPKVDGRRRIPVPPDEQLGPLRDEAVARHLREKLEVVAGTVVPVSANPIEREQALRRARTEAILILDGLVDDEGARRDRKLAEVAAELQDGGRRLLEALQRSRVWLVSARETEGSQWIGVLHDRLAAEVRRTLSDADAIRRFELDPELLALWRFVAQRAAAWGAGDEGAVVVDWARLRALRAREGALPFGEVQRRWWEAVKGEAGRRRHVRVALCVAIVVVVVAANGAWRSDRLQAVDLASGGDPATGEPLRALLRLRTFHRLDGAQLMAALTEGEERGAHSDRAENVFGVGPVGLSGAELASLPDVIEEMAPYVRGTSKPEALWGALLAAADAARHINPDGAVRGRDAVLSAMRAARGEPPSINLEDGTWSSEIGGTFVVGCFEEAGDECLPHETKREVTLSPYRMRVHEEKVVEYWVFAPGRMATRFDRDNSPAVQVSWYEATAYAAWRGAALPTDAQWEVAARGGSSGDYRKGAYYVDATGDGVVDAEDLWFLGIFSGNAQAIRSEDGALRLLTSEEAYRSAPSHPLGLVHIHGNVGEWTVDWYAPEAYQSGSGVVESDLSPVSFTRVVRGGSWSFGAAGARLAYRSGYPPSTRTDDLGFRLVFLMPVDDGI